MSNLAWYVIQVATNSEDTVQTSIIKSILTRIHVAISNEKLEELKNTFAINKDLTEDHQIEEFLRKFVIVVPKEKIEELKNGKKRETERKIFPGYVLINMIYSDEFGLLIRRTPKVAGFVGVGKDAKPVPISEDEVNNILRQVEHAKGHIKHKIEFEVGEKIHIIDGPFSDFNAVVEEVIYNKTRLRVTVQIFGRETGVDLDFAQVAKIV